jgi:hypothetical protein
MLSGQREGELRGGRAARSAHISHRGGCLGSLPSLRRAGYGGRVDTLWTLSEMRWGRSLGSAAGNPSGTRKHGTIGQKAAREIQLGGIEVGRIPSRSLFLGPQHPTRTV